MCGTRRLWCLAEDALAGAGAVVRAAGPRQHAAGILREPCHRMSSDDGECVQTVAGPEHGQQLRGSGPQLSVEAPQERRHYGSRYRRRRVQHVQTGWLGECRAQGTSQIRLKVCNSDGGGGCAQDKDPD